MYVLTVRHLLQIQGQKEAEKQKDDKRYSMQTVFKREPGWLQPEKTNFSVTNVTTDEGHYISMKSSICQENRKVKTYM